MLFAIFLNLLVPSARAVEPVNPVDTAVNFTDYFDPNAIEADPSVDPDQQDAAKIASAVSDATGKSVVVVEEKPKWSDVTISTGGEWSVPIAVNGSSTATFLKGLVAVRGMAGFSSLGQQSTGYGGALLLTPMSYKGQQHFYLSGRYYRTHEFSIVNPTFDSTRKTWMLGAGAGYKTQLTTGELYLEGGYGHYFYRNFDGSGQIDNGAYIAVGLDLKVVTLHRKTKAKN